MTMTGTIYDFKIQSIDGKEIDFAQYKGKTLLIVNTASECGYTPQYADLQELHQSDWLFWVWKNAFQNTQNENSHHACGL